MSVETSEPSPSRRPRYEFAFDAYAIGVLALTALIGYFFIYRQPVAAPAPAEQSAPIAVPAPGNPAPKPFRVICPICRNVLIVQPDKTGSLGQVVGKVAPGK